MKVYLMRHGQAESYAASDAERQLTEKGVSQARAMASVLASAPPVKAIASPYVRACQTALNVIDALPQDIPFETCDCLTPDEDPRTVLSWLATLSGPGPVLIVSHNPLVSLLVSLLVYGHQQASIAMSTADIACVSYDQLGAGTATLEWFEAAP
ncbi:Phosphohistidine phosphatase [gamma proteobacterium HdN1]|nr:Phosphohistidine phosphatase [gamma proteobacterium HdN1]